MESEQLKLVLIGGLMAAVVYFIVSSVKLSHQITLLLISVWLYFAYIIYSRNFPQIEKLQNQEVTKTPNTLAQQPNTLKPFSNNGLQYVGYNSEFVEILKALMFVEIFDKARVSELIRILDNYQKCYMLILSEQFPVASHLPILKELRTEALSILYSLFVVVPFQSDKNNNNKNYKEELEQSIMHFQSVSLEMLDVVIKFATGKSELPNSLLKI